MIKYECEKCNREVYTEEAIGADVYLDNSRGTSFTFTDFIGGTITITYEDKNAGLQQFCHACMFETVVQCLREKFDEETLIKMMGWAYKMLSGPKRTGPNPGVPVPVVRDFITDDVSNRQPHGPNISPDWPTAPPRPGPSIMDWSGPAADFSRPNSLPEGDLYASTDTGDTGESHELSELYASGQLPVPRSDITAERPVKTCICPERDADGKFAPKDPSCPVHSPGGSPG